MHGSRCHGGLLFCLSDKSATLAPQARALCVLFPAYLVQGVVSDRAQLGIAERVRWPWLQRSLQLVGVMVMGQGSHPGGVGRSRPGTRRKLR